MGRKPAYINKKGEEKVYLNTSMTREMHDGVVEFAKSRGDSVANIIRIAVGVYMMGPKVTDYGELDKDNEILRERNDRQFGLLKEQEVLITKQLANIEELKVSLENMQKSSEF